MIFHSFFKYQVKLRVKSGSFSSDNGQTSRFFFFYRIFNDKNFIPKYLDNVLTDSVLTSRTSRRLLDRKPSVNYFVRTVPTEKNCCMYRVSFCCYDNSNVIATLIITNFHLYLTQLWWQFFQMFMAT